MLSNKPYLMRAFYDWIVDSGCIPVLVARADYPQCIIPKDYVENGEIILNISPMAIRDLNISGTVLQFKTSFSGVIHIISIPIEAVVAIYAEENGQGVFFDDEERQGFGETDYTVVAHDSPTSPLSFNSNDAISATPAGKPKPNLKLVE